ncbi:MAG: 4Fe-4S binding protein [Firmicutes bacterium]|nr:4Fe-4S binding protein [Bacillota bacterium]
MSDVICMSGSEDGRERRGNSGVGDAVANAAANEAVDKAAQEDIRRIARKLLSDGAVDVFIGYGQGTLPSRVTPVFVTRPEDADALIWDARCENDLAVYLPGIEGRAGVVVKGCDGRALARLLAEKQVERDRVKIVAVACTGVIDRRRAGRGEGDGAELLHPSCQVCEERTAPVYDFLAGEAKSAGAEAMGAGGACDKDDKSEESRDPFGEIREFEARSSEERWNYFSQEFDRCILCYACRQACPLCYCPECFADRATPKWMGKDRALSDKMVFHLGRAIHLAGRCIDCGACVRACPMGIDLRKLTRKMEKDARVLFDYEAGKAAAAGAPAVFAAFSKEDPDDFVL